MATREPLETLKAPYMVRNPMKWGFLWLIRAFFALNVLGSLNGNLKKKKW